MHRLIVRFDALAQIPMGKTVKLDARVVHEPGPEDKDMPKQRDRPGQLEVTRLPNREIAFGEFRPQ